ncbi:hypothetical protein GRS96_12380 [Rathayibacter sp. VKM Ac-2803]|uniref:DUF6093 family protein n=1 Tax=Rathayibacter sp. VKM Ac-2803 TaxID=2609256 RepID=UPI001356C73D|nr:DUF6093 family protein [Rathayibacter sp. VKM Ac-2803]MWV50066.1 hypothetical protein [Rathayibacter sp. VKM Ac-2803]
MASEIQRAKMRRRAQKRFTETVTIGTRAETQGANLQTVVTIGAPVYAGPAKLKWNSSAVSDRIVASQTVSERVGVLELPIGTMTVHEGLALECTASVADLGLVGRVFRIGGQPQGGETAALRFPITEQSS